MSASFSLRTLLVIWIGLGSLPTAVPQILPLKPTTRMGADGNECVCPAASQIIQLKSIVSTNALYPASLQRGLQLMRSCFVETNKGFDEAVYESVRTEISPPLVISFEMISFTFADPTNTDYESPLQDLAQRDELVCSGGGVSRTSGPTNAIPLSCYRYVDDDLKEPTAALDLMGVLTSLENPKETRFFFRSFRFIYRDGWKADRLVPVKIPNNHSTNYNFGAFRIVTPQAQE